MRALFCPLVVTQDKTAISHMYKQYKPEVPNMAEERRKTNILKSQFYFFNSLRNSHPTQVKQMTLFRGVVF